MSKKKGVKKQKKVKCNEIIGNNPCKIKKLYLQLLSASPVDEAVIDGCAQKLASVQLIVSETENTVEGQPRT